MGWSLRHGSTCPRFHFPFFQSALVDIIEFIPWNICCSVCCSCILNDLSVVLKCSTRPTHTHPPFLFLALREMLQSQRGCWLLQLYRDRSLASYSSCNDLIQPACDLKKQLHNCFRFFKKATTETQNLSGYPIGCSCAVNWATGIAYLEGGCPGHPSLPKIPLSQVGEHNSGLRGTGDGVTFNVPY